MTNLDNIKKEDIKHLTFKDEGKQGSNRIGPVYIVLNEKEKDFFGNLSNKVINLKDSKDKRPDGNGYYAEWVTKKHAKEFAKRNNLKIMFV